MRFANFLLSVLFILTGCFPFADGGIKYINDTNYYVNGEPNFENGVHLGYEDREWGGIGLIKEPITSIGYTDKYILAKRAFDAPEYFILKVIKSGNHSDAEKSMSGPLDSIEFNNEVRNLGIKDFHWKSKFGK